MLVFYCSPHRLVCEPERDLSGVNHLFPRDGSPEKVRVHDFAIPELGRAGPYGVYDLASNTGRVSVGVDRDTASFAVEPNSGS